MSRRWRVLAVLVGAIGLIALSGCSTDPGASPEDLAKCSTGKLSIGETQSTQVATSTTGDATFADAVQIGQRCFDQIATTADWNDPDIGRDDRTVWTQFCSKLASQVDLNAVLGHGLVRANANPSLVATSTSSSADAHGSCQFASVDALQSYIDKDTGFFVEMKPDESIDISYIKDSQSSTAQYEAQKASLRGSGVPIAALAGVGSEAIAWPSSNGVQGGLTATDGSGATVQLRTASPIIARTLPEIAQAALDLTKSLEKSTYFYYR